MGSDLTAHARIRNAALALFAQSGYERTTVRAIAGRAEVSPALVLHHFGSKDGLRAACDEHLLDVMRTRKTATFTGLSMPSLAAYLQASPEMRPLFDYLARVLADGGELAASLFERMTHDVQAYLAAGEDAGTVRTAADPAARAAVSTAMALGIVIFERRIAQRLGGSTLVDPDVLRRYVDVVVDLVTHGIVTRPLLPPDDAPPSGKD